MRFREFERGVVEGVFRPDLEGGVVDEVPSFRGGVVDKVPWIRIRMPWPPVAPLDPPLS